jgi:hypothetical protein
MALLDTQRDNMLAALGDDPADVILNHLELLSAYLASLGFTQPILIDQLVAWANANSIPITLAITEVAT